MNRRTNTERQGMCAKAVLIAMTSIMMTSFAASAAEPYQAKVGDQMVTSVTRPVTRGIGLGREDLLQAARTSRPLQSVPPNALPDIPSGKRSAEPLKRRPSFRHPFSKASPAWRTKADMTARLSDVRFRRSSAMPENVCPNTPCDRPIVRRLESPALFAFH